MSTMSKWLLSVISVSLAAVALAAAAPGYHVIKTYKIGGEGFWDYLTADAERPPSLHLARHPRDRARPGFGQERW